MSHIVVGVDGSEGSKPALRFAVEEAALRGDSVRAVCVWQVPVALYAGSAYAATIEPKIYSDTSRDAARQQIDEVVGSGAKAEVELVVREGGAAHVLVEESADAAMLVVGSRGHGGFAGLLLGSVSQQCATHARCPVTIVHGDKTT
jgi:nucleotide-binding universal stress UspA family protein